MLFSLFTLSRFPSEISDSCEVNNGGCHIFASCSHHAITNAVECRCKTGYTNTGCNCHAFCTGKHFVLTLITIDRSKCIRHTFFSQFICHIIDSCTIKNGGCDPNAVCSHDPVTNAVVCTCKNGFTNTGTTNVTCTGTIHSFTKNLSCKKCRCSSTDDCKIKNGGCDPNADCSHNATTNDVICTCKTGYTDTAPETTKTVCTGTLVFPSRIRYHSTNPIYVLQIVAWSIMVDAMSMLFVHTMKQTMLLNVLAKLVTPILDPVQTLFAQVNAVLYPSFYLIFQF